MAFWKKWTEEVWLAPKEEDDGVVQKQPVQPKRKKKAKVVQQEDYGEPIEDVPIKKTKPTIKDYLLLDSRIRVFYVVVLCAFLGLIFPTAISYYLGEYQADLGNCNTPTLNRFECMSGSSVALTQSSCEAAGCCWDSGSGTPKCYHNNPTRYTYKVDDIVEDSDYKIIVDVSPERRQTDMFGNTMPAARVIVRAVNRDHLIVQMIAPGQYEDTFRLMTEDERTPFSQTDFQVSVSMEKRKSFAVVVRRASTGDVLFDTSYGPLAITEEYVEMSTTVPSEYIYGLGQGERRQSFKRNFVNYGKTALHNRQGADSYHPFFMAVSAGSGLFHGVFWDNSYPLEVQFSPVPAVSFRSMGGSGVFHLLAGSTPSAVSHQFTRDVIGLPNPLPPFWSLGFHLCRENDDPTVGRKTLEQMLASSIGFDSDCIDLRLSGPGMGAVDQQSFPQAANDREWLRNSGKKFILAQPPHVLDIDQFPDNSWILRNRAVNSSTAEDYETGLRLETAVHYPSYPLVNELSDLYDSMLQPEGFNLIDNWPSNENKSTCSDRPRTFTPERIRSSITNNTICLDAFHPTQQLEHVAVHNHYGIQHLKAFVDQAYGYPFLYLNRASALGNLGRAGYPGDDYTANWASMKMALVQVMEMGLFGVALSGSPICGVYNSSTIIDNLAEVKEEQLCTRWYQMGLLLPFAHSMTKLNHRARSPVDWSLNTQRILASYIQLRYKLLSYFYTLFYEASMQGTPVVRPLWYQFPRDNQTYLLSEQFMIGGSLMVCPVMVQDDTETSIPISIYFPSGTWYDYYTGDWIHSGDGERTTVTTGLNHLNMFILNGSVFTTQEPGSSAEQTRLNSYTVTVGFPISSNVTGWLYVDDGKGGDKPAQDLIRFVFTSDTFTMERVNFEFLGSKDISTVVDRVRILGFELKNEQVSPEASYNPYTKILEFNQLNFDWHVSDVYSLKFVIKP
ncbi:maltase-glucoamylase, intestinal [Daphnia magna]|uniref:P-type domain-containing protein n=1 Tax=Daphnia magna TaxID=35525 RepID=A0ABQ9Z571_9CRUS|nr:maltase-glucoamylase, intestinal [Daphnia magna]KAK4008039.1 hypothetical protein OUZ56_013197 [Daphnia magna]